MGTPNWERWGVASGYAALALGVAAAAFERGAPPANAPIEEAVAYFVNDTVSAVAQEQANDLVTLAVGLPLLVVAAWLALRGSLRGRLLLAGTLGFFLYTYMSMAFLAAYNELFLVYVALFALSLYAFVLCMLSFDLADLPRHFAPSLPRRSVAAVLFVCGSFLLLAWLGRIVPPLLTGRDPALDNTTTLVIQAMDLALIVPLCFLAGALLLRRSAWGYLLASVAVLKFITMGLAVSTMALNMARVGVPVSAVELGVFPAITLTNLVVARSCCVLSRPVSCDDAPRTPPQFRGVEGNGVGRRACWPVQKNVYSVQDRDGHSQTQEGAYGATTTVFARGADRVVGRCAAAFRPVREPKVATAIRIALRTATPPLIAHNLLCYGSTSGKNCACGVT